MSHARPARAASLVLAAIGGLCAMAARSQDRASAPSDSTFSAIDEMVIGPRLVSLERVGCDAARAFEPGQCADLVGRSLVDGAIAFRTPLPIPIRGLLQLEGLPLADGTDGILVRAYDRAVSLSVTGTVLEEARVPPSTMDAPVWIHHAHGALVFVEHGGCSAMIAARSELAHGRRVRGAESHIYPQLGGPHDTVCFGFAVLPIGVISLGRDRTGPRVRVVVAASDLQHPVSIDGPAVVGFDRDAVAYQVSVGGPSDHIESASLEGSRAVVIVFDGTTRRRVEVDARSGQRLAVTPVRPRAIDADAGPEPDAGDAPVAYDRRGASLPRFPRCTVRSSGGRAGSTGQLVRFDGRDVLRSERQILVLDQRGDRCVAVELAARTGEDLVHLFAP